MTTLGGAGLNSATDPTIRSEGPETQPDRGGILHGLARRLLHHRRRDLPESGAWGVSPIERYFDSQLERREPFRG